VIKAIYASSTMVTTKFKTHAVRLLLLIFNKIHLPTVKFSAPNRLSPSSLSKALSLKFTAFYASLLFTKVYVFTSPYSIISPVLFINTVIWKALKGTQKSSPATTICLQVSMTTKKCLYTQRRQQNGQIKRNRRKQRRRQTQYRAKARCTNKNHRED
jgi:hypothetical protein